MMSVPWQIRLDMGRECGDTEAERDRQAHLEAERARGSSKRGATAACSLEETARRRDQRSKAEIVPRGAASTTKQEKCNSIAMLYGAEAAEVMKSKPQRVPDLVLEGPHEASPEFHQDWTIVEGSVRDAAKWELELKRRDWRNRLIRVYITEGRAVFSSPRGAACGRSCSLMTPAPSTQYRLQQRSTVSTRSGSRPPRFS